MVANLCAGVLDLPGKGDKLMSLINWLPSNTVFNLNRQFFNYFKISI